MDRLDITRNMTLYPQWKGNTCAAAAARMCRNGYPAPFPDIEYTEDDLWTMMRDTPQEAGWSGADPDHVERCLNDLMNPVGVSWLQIADPNRDVVMSTLLYAMKAAQFPALVLVDGGAHWVVVVGWETDVAPDGANFPVPSEIQYYNPAPKWFGGKKAVSGNDWYTKPYLLGRPVAMPGHWQSQYVAIL